jgi:3-isopropylmalate/(R)-2-methylmalate dehydratase small subunit
MRAFTVVTAKVAPLDRPNVDTDAIIPKQYLKSISRTGFGPFLFDDWRYLDPGTLDIDPATRRSNPDFVLNQAAHAGAQILIARDNFGCGSSREHAVWALDDYGFRAVIAPSYADIFFSNCFKNGVLPVVLKPEEVQAIFELVAKDAGAQITIDLPAQQVKLADGRAFAFGINPHHKHNLVNGLDEIGLTLQQADAIKAYEAKRRVDAPWLFN